jgi:hypothetical protein
MVRFARSSCATAILVVLGCSVQAAAQELASQAAGQELASATTDPLPVAASASPTQPIATPAGSAALRRPAALIPLYTSFVTLQVLDFHSTAYALDRGAVEANPAMKGFVDSRFAMGALKAAGTAGVIFLSEKLRTKNKAAALGLMIASNVAMTWVVQHNYRAAP